MKLQSLLATLFIAATVTGTAHAGLVGVKDIKVTKTAGYSEWIQVTELQAFETGTGTNVALASNGAVATAPSTWNSQSTPDKAIDGLFGDTTFPNMFHNGGANEWLNISLAAPKELSSITIFGRSDCCSYRDVFNLDFYGVNNTLLYSVTGVDATNSDHLAMLELPNTRTGNDVPEPASLALFGAALAGVALRRKYGRA